MHTDPLLPSPKSSPRSCSFFAIFAFFILFSFLHLHRGKVTKFLETTLGVDAYEEVTRDFPEIPRPPDLARSNTGKARMKPQEAGSSSQAGSSSMAGSLSQAGSSSMAGSSSQAGSSSMAAAGSSSVQAGPSSSSYNRRPGSPEISIVNEDSNSEISGHELQSQQYQQDSRQRMNPTGFGLQKIYTSATCGDPVNGFEAKVQLCSSVQIFDEFRLTITSSIMVPMVLNPRARCYAHQCLQRDIYRCCRPRRMCSAYYAKDVTEGCPANEIVNPYKGAFCRTVPCTIGDIDTCCVDPGELWQRTEFLRSKYARVIPDESGAPAVPHISFGYHDTVWLDIRKKKIFAGDEWCPLVNFMSTWGFDTGWETEAWIRLSKKGKLAYKQLTKEKLAPSRPQSNPGPVTQDQL